MRKFLIYATSIASVLIASGAHAQTCTQQSEKLEPFYVMGTLVQPQSNVLATGECGSNYEALNAAYVSQDKADVSGGDDSGGSSGTVVIIGIFP